MGGYVPWYVTVLSGAAHGQCVYTVSVTVAVTVV